ncbi:peptidoglycan editing factor PgeF [Clostridium niameyense]|uniref:peptidoglycan editing factor PgeF n=1 Tax=Clostridium niameyense TaxID=1622073 RepID=UPI00067F0E23|nr:peptidoglycan editing factor PgeF [Clostridium niameyense]
MNFEKINIGQYTFLKFNYKRASFVFSTGEGNLKFNRGTKEGLDNLRNIKEWFNLKNVGYLNQIHSNIICEFKEDIHEEGDGIMTDKSSTAIGVFTADCVPILLYDSINNAIASVHSGWRGTYNHIVIESLKNMNKKYNTNAEDVVVCIGPHIGQCCYEVSYDLIQKFKEDKTYGHYKISNEKNYLNLQECIKAQLLKSGVRKENILTINMCTFCSKGYKFNSYRKTKNTAGQFSFVYIN